MTRTTKRSPRTGGVWAGSAMKAIRTRLKLTQQEFASALGLHANTLARIERGEMPVRQPTLKLARILSEQQA